MLCLMAICFVDCSLREKIIQELLGKVRFGRDKMLALVSSDYYGLKLTSNVAYYVERCFIF
jgi:hypothetical protein